MTAKSKRILVVILVALVTVFASLVFIAYEQTRGYARIEAEKLVVDMLLNHRAIHAYIAKVQRPEMYRLKQEGKLYEDYFSPKTMSFTYIARSIKEFLNEERKKEGMPQIYFKLATDNPRNPINQADAWESQLLKRMNAGEVKDFHEVIEKEGKQYLYAAIPIAPSDSGCLVCHGSPAAAPRELLDQYGDKGGFHEKLGTSRALISLRVPLDPLLASANGIFWWISIAFLLALSGLYGLIHFFIRRLDRSQYALVKANDELLHLSSVDYLTNICNRRCFTDGLDQMINHADRYGNPLSIMIIDLDHFKRVNDQYGHNAGDEVLKAFARLIGTQIRASDLFARWGGEEFIIAMPNQDQEKGMRAAEKLRHTVKENTFPEGIRISISIGVAIYGKGLSRDELINQADSALYSAKENGRDRVMAFGQREEPTTSG
ncbi:MAG: diguanylate cyclase [Gammaproteobacteria bacterium]|nr:diguanylate cyclase [Gammaproteobacteria bacterium]MBU1654807.1 diguanylate cyclase [Gammaproteobacteria bacterium]MBU1960548.1 diguanylate cyclase [Gammaproteobacteria bacterium]